jgi:ubiquinone/menaquinone biosynthesis C-methylase UbiE
MAKTFWTGRFSSPSARFKMNVSNLASLFKRELNACNSMKARVENGYSTKTSDSVSGYDIIGNDHFTRIAKELIDPIELSGKKIIEIGGGTGILSFELLNKGCDKILCTDISDYMLNHCKEKANSRGYGPNRIDFKRIDAEAIPKEEKFDISISSMMLGMVPDQMRVVSEMASVVKPGGLIAIATHGPYHYNEALEASMDASIPKYAFGYRIEFWPYSEKNIRTLFLRNGIKNIRTNSKKWTTWFEDENKAYDFFAATSATWWYAIYPRKVLPLVIDNTREIFRRRKMNYVTSDVTFAYGTTPNS